MVVGGWWLVVGGWWFVVGGWWLVVGCWWLVVGGWWLVVGGRWLVVGGWWLVAGGWWLAGWSLVSGVWWLVAGGLVAGGCPTYHLVAMPLHNVRQNTVDQGGRLRHRDGVVSAEPDLPLALHLVFCRLPGIALEPPREDPVLAHVVEKMVAGEADLGSGLCCVVLCCDGEF